ncbi:MAG: efflux RND transporter periplasmic adaptor subunit [Bacteroidota bacterium]
MNKHKIILSISVFILGGVIVAILRAGNSQNATSGFTRPPAPVTIAIATAADVPVYLDEIGKCVAREMVSVQPQVSGRIIKIHFADGAEVREGDTLFTIDPRPYRASFHGTEADLEQSKSALELAKIQFDRAAKLLESKDVAQSDYDIANNAVETADAQVKRNEAALENARLNLDYCFIRSPINGRAGRRLIDIGNVVAPTTGVLLSIQKMDPIYADFVVNENDLPVVKENMAKGSLQVEVWLPDETTPHHIGTLTFLDNAVQSGSGTVALRATVPNNERLLWPGEFVKVRLVLNTIRSAVLVPAAASLSSAKGPIVFVVKDDSTADMRPVALGQRQGDLIVIDKGLHSGERVIVAGQIAVAPGAKVRIADIQTLSSESERNAGTKQ